MNDSVLALHNALVDALSQRQHHNPRQPVTVAEIYQDLIPYRMVRTTAGFALNADYEHALLKLLAGDGGFARVEPTEVQTELQAELKSANPNAGIFRNYAACDVFITVPADFETRRQERTTAPAVPAAEQEPLARPSTHALPAPAEPVTAAIVFPTATADSAFPSATPPAAAPVGAGPGGLSQVPAFAPMANGAITCAACKAPLPSGRTARYCPFCGHDQSRPHCASCREPLEPNWKYCVACGAPA